MIVSKALLALLPIAFVLGDSNTSCQRGSIKVKGRQCDRYCGYELTGSCYQATKQPCYQDCIKSCAGDSRCKVASWNRRDKKCRLSGKGNWRKTSKGDGVHCAAPPNYPKTTTRSKSTTGKTTASKITTTRTSTASISTTAPVSTIPSTTTASATTSSTAQTNCGITIKEPSNASIDSTLFLSYDECKTRCADALTRFGTTWRSFVRFGLNACTLYSVRLADLQQNPPGRDVTYYDSDCPRPTTTTTTIQVTTPAPPTTSSTLTTTTSSALALPCATFAIRAVGGTYNGQFLTNKGIGKSSTYGFVSSPAASFKLTSSSHIGTGPDFDILFTGSPTSPGTIVHPVRDADAPGSDKLSCTVASPGNTVTGLISCTLGTVTPTFFTIPAFGDVLFFGLAADRDFPGTLLQIEGVCLDTLSGGGGGPLPSTTSAVSTTTSAVSTTTTTMSTQPGGFVECQNFLIKAEGGTKFGAYLTRNDTSFAFSPFALTSFKLTGNKLVEGSYLSRPLSGDPASTSTLVTVLRATDATANGLEHLFCTATNPRNDPRGPGLLTCTLGAVSPSTFFLSADGNTLNFGSAGQGAVVLLKGECIAGQGDLD